MKLSIFSLKIEILLGFLRLGSKLFHPIIVDEKKKKKRIFEKVMLYLNKGNIIYSSYSLWYTSYRSKIKKVFWMFILENFIKETKISVPMTKLRQKP